VPAATHSSVRARAPVEAVVLVQGQRGGSEILAAAPGHAARRLTKGIDAVPSPDGTRMLVERGGVWYAMRADGTQQRRLPGPVAADPWSPNGRWVALHDRQHGTLSVIGRDGSTAVPVASGVSSAAWSRNSRQLAYAFDPQTAGVYTLHAAGAAPAATVLLEGQWASHPDWSPDGRRVAYVVGRSGAGDVYVANADGSAPVRLTTTDARESDPAWSPNGKQLAFASARDGNWEIYVMNDDGSAPRRVTSHPARDQAPAWSPDGSRLAFHSARFGNEEIFVVALDGSGTIRVTSDAAANRQSDWAPDGSALTYSASGDISVVGPDGTTLVRLTTQQLDNAPQWSPDGTRIAFERNGRILAVGRGGGQPQLVYGGRAPAADPTWSPGGDVSFWIAHQSDLARFDVRAKTVHRVTQTPEDETEPALSPNGRNLAFRRAGRIAVRDLRSGTVTTVAEAEFGAFDWSPSGRFIGYDRDGDLFRVRPDGSQRRRIVATRGRVAWAWATRDDRLAYSVTDDGWGVALVVVHPGGAKRSIRPATLDGLSPPVWSPSSQKLAYAGIRHDVRQGVVDVYVNTARTRSSTRVVRVTRSLAWPLRGWVRVGL
jgi:Tol biopolymer transport system component